MSCAHSTTPADEEAATTTYTKNIYIHKTFSMYTSHYKIVGTEFGRTRQKVKKESKKDTT